MVLKGGKTVHGGLHGHPAQGTVLSRPSKKVNIHQIRQRLVELQEKQKEQFDRAHRAKDLCPLKGQGTSPVLSQQTRHRPHQVDNWHSDWNIRMWMILHDPGPQQQSLQKEQSSLEAHMSWQLLLSRPSGEQREETAQRQFPFKTIRPVRPNPCPLRVKWAIWTPGSMMFDEPDTHQTPPTSPSCSPPASITPKVPLT